MEVKLNEHDMDDLAKRVADLLVVKVLDRVAREECWDLLNKRTELHADYILTKSNFLFETRDAAAKMLTEDHAKLAERYVKEGVRDALGDDEAIRKFVYSKMLEHSQEFTRSLRLEGDEE